MTGRKEAQRRKRERWWGVAYAEANESRDDLAGRPDALEAYDKRRKELDDEAKGDDNELL